MKTKNKKIREIKIESEDKSNHAGFEYYLAEDSTKNTRIIYSNFFQLLERVLMITNTRYNQENIKPTIYKVYLSFEAVKRLDYSERVVLEEIIYRANEYNKLLFEDKNKTNPSK